MPASSGRKFTKRKGTEKGKSHLLPSYRPSTDPKSKGRRLWECWETPGATSPSPFPPQQSHSGGVKALPAQSALGRSGRWVTGSEGSVGPRGPLSGESRGDEGSGGGAAGGCAVRQVRAV